MKHLTIVVPDGQNNISSITGSYEIWSRANLFWKEKTGKNLFKIEVAGMSKEVEYEDGLFAVRPHTQITAIAKTDLVLIPSLNHNYRTAVKGNQALIDWIAGQYKNGAEIASVCTGTFLLASAGLLEGKTCSTHWSVAEHFRSMFPGIDLQTDRLITDENGIYTNGGAYSFLNLLLYLIEKKYDRPTAIYCAKVFQIEMDRHSQSAFIIFKGQKQHGDEMIREAQALIENNVHERVSIEHLSSRFAIGRRNFDRRFIKATGNTPLEYTQRVKIEAAKKAFETSRKTINEVMYDVGYSDVKAFRDVFRKVTGMSPLEYRSKYNASGATPTPLPAGRP
ncbi:GlxA family transcriptional regulator [Dinghuibacter silviterrae]|uniref:Transcriptional regulator GlxA family with amidase domain n=1 Tax=Dinghuibacter silviterrae TaxID=1539049 RepID=A0A4R8DX28_9BACT|nr:helix-turn-helix domain-containing protein [Dinghuibacter silviterrae]TDX02085.1 transcriptional regulator GlxA family with amidase domain [Dinghuibacter silviterrae]